MAPRRAAPYSKGGREQGKPSGWYDSYRTQILNAKRVQYLLKHRVDGSRDGDTPSSILQKRNQILYRNAFMKMKCVRNMYRKKKCCDELLMRVTRTERDEEGPSLLETGPAGGGLGGGDEGGNMTATATNLQRHNALLEAKDLIVEKKLKLVRELGCQFLGARRRSHKIPDIP